MSQTVNLIINGKAIIAKAGERLIDVADQHGFYIPRFCYHPKLSVVASCRMCMVDVEGMPKVLPACATDVEEGMVVHTASAKSISAQKAIMEFLLVNHPLNCPICDQGGECELQDTAMGYGQAVSNFSEYKRVVDDENLGYLVATDMSLCILCTRCVRFGQEIAGIAELGLIGRGDKTEISTYLSTGLKSELSGNVIDLCPVGALTSKPFKFKGRSWGFSQHSGIAAHDCVGSHLYYHTIGLGYQHLSEVMRVIPKDNPALNEAWLSDRDRFSYQAIHADKRLLKPMIKVAGDWTETTWEEVLPTIIEDLQALMEKDKLADVGVLLSNQMTMEEGYICQKVFRQIGVKDIDFRLLHNSDQAPMTMFPAESVSPNDLEQQEVIILLGSNIRFEQPMLSLRVKKACARGARVYSLGAISHDHYFPCEHRLCSPQRFAREVYTLFNELDSTPDQFRDWVKDIHSSEKVTVLLGEEVLTHPLANEMIASCQYFCKKLGYGYARLTRGPNQLGLQAAGCTVDHLPWGESAMPIDRSEKKQWFWLHNVDPDYDVAHPKKLYQQIRHAKCIALTAYDTPGIREVATVMLPLASIAESPGSYMNYLGQRQLFEAAIKPLGDAKMGWSIYQVLGKLLGVDSPQDFSSLDKSVTRGCQRLSWDVDIDKPKAPEVLSDSWIRVGLPHWVGTDSQVRHASALKSAHPELTGVAWVNHKTTFPKNYSFQVAKQVYALKASTHIAPGAVVIPSATHYTRFVGPSQGALDVMRNLS